MLKYILIFLLTLYSSSYPVDEQMSIRVAGGENAFKNEFPWIVNLKFDTQQEPPFCGAVIISPDWVLTAAHCMVMLKIKNKPISEVLLTAGDHNLQIEEESEQMTKISKFVIHDLYKPSSKVDRSYDFALLKVSDPFLYNEFVKPVTFPENNFAEGNSRKNFTVAGWGLHSVLYSHPHDILQKADLEIIDLETCKKYYENATMIGESMICAVHGFKAPCEGDSGSGFVEIIEDTLIKSHVLHGIVSFGPEDCNEKGYGPPGVFGNVSFISDWINSYVPGTIVTTTTADPCKQTNPTTNPTSTSSDRSALVGLLFICNCLFIQLL